MMQNQQAPERKIQGNRTTLSVHSIFHTIQGEGPFAGTPAVFLRLAGCNLQCPFCDTEYTEGRMEMTVEEIAETVYGVHGARPTNLVVITGGEPFRQSLEGVVGRLTQLGYSVQIETNGTLPHTLGRLATHPEVTIVCSPKTGRVHPETDRHVAAYKYLLHKDSVDPVDGLPTLALNHSAAPRVARPRAGFRGPVYLQPIDVQDPAENAAHADAVVESCTKYGYRLCLQMHKIVNVP